MSYDPHSGGPSVFWLVVIGLVAVLAIKGRGHGGLIERGQCYLGKSKGLSIARQPGRCGNDSDCELVDFYGCEKFVSTAHEYAFQLREIDQDGKGPCRLDPGECRPLPNPRPACVGGFCSTAANEPPAATPAATAAAAPAVPPSPTTESVRSRFKLKIALFPYAAGTRAIVNGVPVDVERYLGDLPFEEPIVIAVNRRGFAPFRQEIKVYPSMVPADGIYQKEIRLERAVTGSDPRSDRRSGTRSFHRSRTSSKARTSPASRPRSSG
jgi:hypothetical protein